ncbi:MAG: histidine phosphatase family protein [Sporichthyaceae bacterium]|nr:histidine phosphatase family protein [Sporichthyaceae bacterium]
MPQTLWLLRHAESEGNLADTRAQDAGADRLELQARDADMPLSSAGEEQADALGRSWRQLAEGQRPTVVLSSPYERAFRTATRAVAAAGFDIDVVRDERLRERDLGQLDGYTKQGIEAHFPGEAERRVWVGKFYYRPPGGESWADVAGRVRAVVDAVERRYVGERLLLVTHQAVMMVARYVLENLTEQEILDLDAGERIANTGVIRYRYVDGVPSLESFNDTSHLDVADAPMTEEPDATAVSE